MSINISDDLLKSIQQELLVSLQVAEAQLVDLLEFGDTQEVDEILDVLHLVKNTLVILSETAIVKICDELYTQIKLVSEGNKQQVNQDKLSLDFLWLVQAIGALGLKNIHSNTDSLFPVAKETIESIAFSKKKDIGVIKNLLEKNIHHLDNQAVVESLSDMLNRLLSTFKLLNHLSGVSLIERLMRLLENHSVAENIEEFTDSLILLEDALWQLDTLPENSQNNCRSSQIQHSRQMAIKTAKVTFAKNAYLFFKQLRQDVIENFACLDNFNMMYLAEEIHKIVTASIFFQEYQLAKLLHISEQRHLFFQQEKTAIKQPNINQYYLDVIVVYEIVFAQLQRSNAVNQYALSLIEVTQKQLLSQIDFSAEKMAVPDYYYADNNQLSVDMEEKLLDISDNAKVFSDTDIAIGIQTSTTAGTKEITDSDYSILKTFLAEAKAINQINKENLANWQNDDNLAIIQKIQRNTHTLKGGAYMVGLNILGDLSHCVEALLVGIANGEINNLSGAKQLLVEANNISNEIIELAENHQVINGYPDYFVRLSAFLETETGRSLDNTLLIKRKKTSDKVAGFSAVDGSQKDQLNGAEVRFDTIKKRMTVLVQQLSKELDKPIRLEIQGGDINIQCHILEKLMAGFEHAVRNAIVHGIESVPERKAKGKEAIGRIHLGVYRHGAELLFTIADDGRGADLNVIRERARILGILDEKLANDNKYLLHLLFETGFSTANEVTQFCGRGIGLDVLKESVNTVDGSIEIDSQVDKGMMICLRVPIAK